MKTEPMLSDFIFFLWGFSSLQTFEQAMQCSAKRECVLVSVHVYVLNSNFENIRTKGLQGLYSMCLKAPEFSGSDFKALKVLTCKFNWCLVLGSPGSFF